MRDYRSDLSDLRAAAEHPSFRPESAGGMRPGQTGGEAARTTPDDGSKQSGMQPDKDSVGGAGAAPKDTDQIKGKDAAPGPERGHDAAQAGS